MRDGDMAYWRMMDMNKLTEDAKKKVKESIIDYLYGTNNVVSDIVNEVLSKYYKENPTLNSDKYTEEEQEEITEWVMNNILK